MPRPKRYKFKQSKKYEILIRDLLSTKLKKEITRDNFSLFSDKKYKGKSGHEHQIDVSAEIKIAGFLILILVECKLYSRSVGIEDVLEFASRLEDIGAHKGIIISTKGFQDGAKKIAKSKGIALAIVSDLGIKNEICFESPVLEQMRHKNFMENLKHFLRNYLPQNLSHNEFRNIFIDISNLDVTSALNVKTFKFCSLRENGGSYTYANMFAPKHAYIIFDSENNIVLGKEALFELIIKEIVLTYKN